MATVSHFGWWRRLSCSVLFMLVLCCPACANNTVAGADKKGAVGESCVKSSDCEGSLVCLTGTCSTQKVDAGDAVDADDVSTDIMAAEGEETPDQVGPTDHDGTTDPGPQDTLNADAVTDTSCVPDCDGKSCSDGCGGVCLGVACDDTNACTTGDLCASDGCAGIPLKCDDGSKCTTSDVCANGKCSGTNVDCDDGNVCTDNACDASTGCTVTVVSKPCDDGSACTTGDLCSAGKCSGMTMNCDDKNPCTVDSCDPFKGCTAKPVDALCDDDNPCTLGDVCKGGACLPGQPKLCESGSACIKATCGLVDGKCKFSDVDNGSPCDDDSACTQQDVCALGDCKGVKVDCDDKKACTIDTCTAVAGCLHVPATTACDDGNACTSGDVCKDANCTAGAVVKCDDNNPCTKDACSVKVGGCAFDATSLDGTACDADGSVCTSADQCVGGTCVPGQKLNCDDANACTLDVCDAVSGCAHSNTSTSCNADDNACTADVCKGGKCTAGPPPACDDNNTCTVDGCNSKTGECLHDAPPTESQVCDADSNVCTAVDTCVKGACVAGSKLNCDDANVCTDDSCDPKVGCKHLANTAACDADGSACTMGDACTKATCKTGTTISCDDGNPCTNDVCAAQTGQCSHVANIATCDDGDPCTKSDGCAGGSCKGTAVACDPCMNYGGTFATVVENHIKICTSKVSVSDVGSLVVVGGWHTCGKYEMLKWSPNSSLAGAAKPASPYTNVWLGEFCLNGGGTQSHVIYNACSTYYFQDYCPSDYNKLNDSNAYYCSSGAYSYPFFVCHD
jgi:hypothetical protein